MVALVHYTLHSACVHAWQCRCVINATDAYNKYKRFKAYKYHKPLISFLPDLEGESYSRHWQHLSKFFPPALASNPALQLCFPLGYS